MINFYGNRTQQPGTAGYFAARQTSRGSSVKHPILELHGEKSDSSSQSSANMLKVLTFGGRSPKFSVAPHVKLESQFIHDLKQEKDPDVKAGLAEMLGRVKTINALPALVEITNRKEAAPVRIAAINALADVTSSTHEESYTRTSVGQHLMSLYRQRKSELGNQKPERGDKNELPAKVSAKKELLDEISAIANALGKINYPDGNDLLQQEFEGTINSVEKHNHMTQTMMRALKIAEKNFFQSLENQFKKPIKEIIKDVPQDEISRLKGETPVMLPDGTTKPFKEIQAEIKKLTSEHRVSKELLVRIMDGLAQRDTNQFNSTLESAVDSNYAEARAKAIEILGPRGRLSFADHLYPALKHESPAVRQEAAYALLHSSESVAKDKLMELMNPETYFQVTGIMDPEEGIHAYADMVVNMAANGDRYINSLQKLAVGKDNDLTSRKMALVTLKLMTEEPMSKEVSTLTLEKAKRAIRVLAQQAPANSPEEKEEINKQATMLWVGLKEPEAVARALNMIQNPAWNLSLREKETMLGSIFKSVQEDYNEVRSDRDPDGLKRQIVDIVKTASNLPISEEQLDAFASNLKPGLLQKFDHEDGLKLLMEEHQKEIIDTEFVSTLKDNIEVIRPVLTDLLEKDGSLATRSLAARLLGVLEDKGAVEKLIEKTRDPLKGLFNWRAERSYRGHPANDGAKIRLNNIIALGQIGDAKGADVMADALDDPTLKRYVLGPISRLGDAVSGSGDKKLLKRVQEKLYSVMNSDDTTRLARAIRIAAADALIQYDGGIDVVKNYAAETGNPNFKRHALSALISNDYALDPSHADHALVKDLLNPELGVSRIHAKGITGKGVEMAIIDGGYVDKDNEEAFQKRVKLPPNARDPEHTHPTMVMTTAAGNGKIKGVAPDALVYSDKWPELTGPQTMEVYKKIIEGKLRGENNIQVINNSWGFSDNNVIIFKEVREALKEFKKVVELAEKAGIQIVFSAGNSGEELGIPGLGTMSLFGLDVDKLTNEQKEDLHYILDKVILVGASNTQGSEELDQHRLAEFSSLGDTLNGKLLPTVVAPGVDMMVYSYEDGKRGKELVNGTSFSGPYVSGLLTLMLQQNPNLKPAHLRSILKNTSRKLDNLPETYQGHGEVDPHAALAKAKSFGKRQAKPKGGSGKATA